MDFTPEEIATKEFIVSLRGYDRDEVRAFLEEVAADYEDALAAASRAAVPIDPYDALGREVGEILKSAQAFADQVRAKAEHELQTVRGRGQEEAGKLTEEARLVREEAEKRAAEMTAGAIQEAKELIEGAREEAERLTAAAREQAEEIVSEGAARVDKLRAVEAEVRGQLERLERIIQEARAETGAVAPAEVASSNGDLGDETGEVPTTPLDISA